MEISLDTGPLAYLEKGCGRPFLLLNGFPFGAAEFAEVLEALSWSSRAIAVDLPGIGGSAPLPDPSPGALAGAVLFALAKFGLDSFVLAATDAAGPVGLEILERQPGMVSGALFFGTWAEPDGVRVPEYLVGGKTGILDFLRSRARLEKELGRAMGRADRLQAADLEVAEANLSRGGRRRGADLFRASLAAPFARYRETLPRFRKPVRILWGDRDPVSPRAQFEAFRRLFPGARAASDPEAGHFLGLEKPDLLAQALQELGKQAWGPPASAGETAEAGRGRPASL